MLKVAFYLENHRTGSADLRFPDAGNPGCGGTQFLFAALPYYLMRHAADAITPIILANDCRFLPDGITSSEVSSAVDAVYAADRVGADVFVYRPRRDIERDVLGAIEARGLRSIAWCHITPKPEHLRALAENRSVRSIVCVEHEQYDLVADMPRASKLTYIVNPFSVDGFAVDPEPIADPNLVVFLGALVPQKGFHLLAEAWPHVRGECPNARLDVIGTGGLYGTQEEIGPLGVASNEYETEIILPHLGGLEGAANNGVTFRGAMGLDKRDLLCRASVGVVNPSGQTENCPGSALEFQALRTPVVSGARYGMLDTVRHGRTGYLARNKRELIRYIVELIHNPDLARTMGGQACEFVRKRYEPREVVRSWKELIEAVAIGRPIRRPRMKKNLGKHYKYLVAANRYPQAAFGLNWNWPTVEEAKAKAMSTVRTLLRRG